MATATTPLKEKVKKIASALTNGHEDEEVMYFKDEFALDQWEREIEPALRFGSIALKTFNRLYSIDDISEFFAMLKDPLEFYKHKHRIAHQSEFEKYDSLGVELKITAPKGFEDVMAAAGRAARSFEKQNHRHFDIEADEIVLTTEYYNRRNARCYLTARGKEEIELLNYCLEVIAALEKLEPILLRNKRLTEAVKTKKYALPLNYFLKIVNTKQGAKLIPNPVFVREGFAGSAHLGIYIPSKAERKLAQKDAMPKLGEKWVKFKRTLKGGGTKDFLVLQSEAGKHITPSDQIYDGYRNEFDEPWGTPLNSQHARPAPVTQWTPFNK